MSRLAPLSLMRFFFLLAFSLPLVYGRAVTAVTAVQNEPRALIPDLDPFYQPPDGYESKDPGTILRKRLVLSSFFGLLPSGVETWQLLYRTTALDGSPIATVTTVFKPLLAKKDRFVSFHTAYDSSATICKPSYNYRLGSVQTDLISSLEFLLLEAYLLSGYIVASPDYEGPEDAFAAGRLAATGVLDGMRAVTNFKSQLGFTTKTPMVVGVGYSGGAIATGWAASLHPTYAPEIQVKGWVQGGTPANLTSVYEYVDDTLFTGFLPTAIAGLAKPSAYGAQLQPILDEILTEKGKAAIDFVNKNCVVADVLAFAEQSTLDTSFQTLGAGLLQQSDIAKIMKELTMGVNKAETPTAPVFIYHATDDEVIPYKNVPELYNAWCKNGASVKFTTFENGGHATTEVVAIVDALKFVKSAFAGTLATGCSQSTSLSDDLSLLSLGVSLEPVVVGLIEILAAAGKKDVNIRSNPKTLEKTL